MNLSDRNLALIRTVGSVAAVLVAISTLAVGGWLYRGSNLPTPTPSPSPSPSPSPVVAPFVVGQDRVITLWAADSLGHGCPIGPTIALTAAHVILERTAPNTYSALPQVWGDPMGHSGTVRYVYSDVRRDIALLEVVPGTAEFSGWFDLATQAPRIGEYVYVIGYDYEQGLKDKTVKAKVINIIGSIIVYSDTPGPGSSGSCTLNGRGEVVAINTAMINGHGLGVLVTGQWAGIPEQFRQ